MFFHISVVNSPRLGSASETIAHVIINANDDAFGTLQLSASIVRVAENYVGPIINVTRTGGIFADVSVKFKAMPITATAGKKSEQQKYILCVKVDRAFFMLLLTKANKCVTNAGK